MVVLTLACGAVFGLSGPHVAADQPMSERFRAALPGYAYAFPRDHGSHDEFRTEWWYYTGHVIARNGRRFGYQLTFFRRRMDPERVGSNPSRWALHQLYLAHFAITDVDRSRFQFAEKLSRAGLGKAGADTGRLHVWIDHWSAEASADAPSHHHLRASTPEFAVDLTLTPAKPAVVHGQDGLSRKGAQPGQASHYYSLTRLGTEGSVTIQGEPFAVTGTSWMDHEFGSGDLGKDQVGWDWFSVQLDNDTELMLYRLRRTDGSVEPMSSGTWVPAHGRAQALTVDDVHVEARGTWTSRASGARYPSGWRVTVPQFGLALDLAPLLADQELITRRSTQITYWEGAVRARGTLHGTSVTGQGYVELIGYAERFRQRL